ncbi:MAG: dihydrodipicolinate synthase family protein [Clostridia bacterium]|nr:dihydrodipicolinate synthase family protein [Clostridia bacterium]
MKMKLEGTFAVLMTPFIGDKVDYVTFEKQVKRLSGTDVAGYVVNGSTAEFIHLSKEEKKKLVEIVANVRDADKAIIVSACEPNVPDACEICEHAKSVNADAVLICPPYYFCNTAEEMTRYYREIANHSPLPIILYNIPFFTQELGLDIIASLMRHDNVIGIKDSSGNMKRIMHTIHRAKGFDFNVLTGTDDMLFPAFVGGCAGSMTALATIYPQTISSIYRLVKNGDLEKAREVQHSILDDLRRADSQTFPKGYKRLMEEVSKMKFGDKGVIG